MESEKILRNIIKTINVKNKKEGKLYVNMDRKNKNKGKKRSGKPLKSKKRIEQHRKGWIKTREV